MGARDAYNGATVVEIVFLMLVLKLPIIYLVGVVIWAVRAEPRPPEPAVLQPASEPGSPAGPRPLRTRGPRRGGPRDKRPARKAERLASR